LEFPHINNLCHVKGLSFVINIPNAFGLSSAKCGMGSSKKVHLTTTIRHQKQGVTPEQAISALQKKGITIDEEEAKIILDFLYILAKLAINQYFNSK
jgi:hypothetical protein